MKAYNLKYFLILSVLITPFAGLTQSNSKPKLVVGIVVDQMRYDYLYRYAAKYGNGGFKRLLKQGYSVENCHFNYMPTYTGPGHASVYTGCTPSTHGIIANDWFDKATATNVYCVSDKNVQTVGANGTAGQMAPTRMLSSTIGDELKINTVNKAKVFGVALKDRASILPAGHGANAAFWFDDSSGKWISSSFYFNGDTKKFPEWLNKANSETKNLFVHHLDKPWNTLYDINTYTESIGDDNSYERPFKGETKPVFPHDLKAIQALTGHYGIIKATPFGNTITKDFAKMLIENEQLGVDAITDLLCISFSSTDYIGHQFGPSSVEMEDAYLRLDKDLEDLLLYLDKKIGKGKYTVFLTADHGAVEVPQYLKEFNIPGGYVNELALERGLDSVLTQKFGALSQGLKYVLSYSNQQVFFNTALFAERTIDLSIAKESVRTYLMGLSIVANVYDAIQMQTEEYHKGAAMLIQNGFNAKRSGQLLVNYQPGVIEYENKGTTHGSPYSYDTHIPLLFYGWGVKPGITTAYCEITQIAATMCHMLHIPFTNGNAGHIIDLTK